MISLGKYARHRGCSLTAVQKAIRSGRLRDSVVQNEKGHPKIASLALADAEWLDRTDASRQRGKHAQRVEPVEPVVSPSVAPIEPHESDNSVSVPTYHESKARHEAWRARMAELEYFARAGKLVDAEAVARRMATIVTIARTRLLGVPSKLFTRRPHLSREDLVAIENEIRDALQELSTLNLESQRPGKLEVTCLTATR